MDDVFALLQLFPVSLILSSAQSNAQGLPMRGRDGDTVAVRLKDLRNSVVAFRGDLITPPFIFDWVLKTKCAKGYYIVCFVLLYLNPCAQKPHHFAKRCVEDEMGEFLLCCMCSQRLRVIQYSAMITVSSRLAKFFGADAWCLFRCLLFSAFFSGATPRPLQRKATCPNQLSINFLSASTMPID